jgi:hypothetical protein
LSMIRHEGRKGNSRGRLISELFGDREKVAYQPVVVW